MPYCENCGEQLQDNAKFCRHCGTPVPQTEDINTEETAAEPMTAEQETAPVTEESPAENTETAAETPAEEAAPAAEAEETAEPAAEAEPAEEPAAAEETAQEPAEETPAQDEQPAQEAAQAAPAAAAAAPASDGKPVKEYKPQSKAGIVSFVLSMFKWLALPAFIVGLVDLIRNRKDKSHGFARAGVIISSIILAVDLAVSAICGAVITKVVKSIENGELGAFIQGIQQQIESGITNSTDGTYEYKTPDGSFYFSYGNGSQNDDSNGHHGQGMLPGGNEF